MVNGFKIATVGMIIGIMFVFLMSIFQALYFTGIITVYEGLKLHGWLMLIGLPLVFGFVGIGLVIDFWQDMSKGKRRKR